MVTADPGVRGDFSSLQYSELARQLMDDAEEVLEERHEALRQPTTEEQGLADHFVARAQVYALLAVAAAMAGR